MLSHFTESNNQNPVRPYIIQSLFSILVSFPNTYLVCSIPDTVNSVFPWMEQSSSIKHVNLDDPFVWEHTSCITVGLISHFFQSLLGFNIFYRTFPGTEFKRTRYLIINIICYHLQMSFSHGTCHHLIFAASFSHVYWLYLSARIWTSWKQG